MGLTKDQIYQIAFKMFNEFKDKDLKNDSKSWVRFMKNWEHFNKKYGNNPELDRALDFTFKYLKGVYDVKQI